MNYRLIVSILPRDTGDILMQAANKAGAFGGTILVGTGTSPNAVIQLLGLGERRKDILFTVVDEKVENDVIKAIKSQFEINEIKKLRKGVIFSINVNEFIRHGVSSKSVKNGSKKEEKKMNENEYTMITAILNKGYAEDAMEAARNAGAKGGTILAAHGTARPGDDKFFGVEIVPEKDLLLILVPKNETEKILEAIKNLECLKKPGSGITFCSSAHNFTFLGKN